MTGSYVQTGAGGVLKVAKLFLNDIQQENIAKILGDGFVFGSGWIEVGGSGPPTIVTVPAEPANPTPASGTLNVHPMVLTKLDWDDSWRCHQL